MNPHTLLAAAVILAGAPVPPSHAEPKPDIGILFEYIEVDHRTADQLIRKHATQLDASPFREELQSLITAEKARLLESTYLSTKSGQRAKDESIRELLYPTEFEPPSPPQTIPSFTPFYLPNAFDARNVGTTVEIDPVITPDGKHISVGIAPEIVLHLGSLPTTPFENAFALTASASNPLFHTMRISSALRIRSGQTHFAAQLTPSPRKSPGKRVLLFVHARILPSPKP